MPTVLIANDDGNLLAWLQALLDNEGLRVVTAIDSCAALAQARDVRPDLAVLDWRLPPLDGPEVARRIRAADAIPVLMLATRDTVETRVAGLEDDADDFLVKPVVPAELLTRVRALLRRGSGPLSSDGQFAFADLRLDPSSHEAQRGQRHFMLTPKEFDLLSYLMRHTRRVLPRKTILDDVWGYDFGDRGKTLDVYIGYLRAKTEAGGEPRLIQTVRGVGYILRNEP